MEYKKIFNPYNKVALTKKKSMIKCLGDRCSKPVYVYDETIILAVNVAIATGRPILVRGPSGWGKSSLAKSVADILGRRYYENVISSRTQARDLLWEVDMIRRLQDAQVGKLESFTHYIKPGVLWRAFNFKSAQIQEIKALSPTNLKIFEEQDYNNHPQNHPRAVVLLDEIDKADPDLPNNLLIPLGSLYFTVEETGTKVECEYNKPPLIFITTNDERELPPAFLRRCIELQLSKPNLLEVGKAHFNENLDIVEKVAGLLENTEGEQDIEQFSIQSSSPSPAEFIDTVNACIKLGIDTESKVWDMLKKTTIWKHGRTERV
jgi:MoxR-like ATPase